MRREEVFEKVKAVVQKQMGVEEDRITPDSTFIEDLGADSLDTVELMMSVEEEFGIRIPEEEAVKLTSVNTVIDYVLSLPTDSAVSTPIPQT